MTTELLNLGKLYVSDFLAPDEEPRAEPAELRLVMDDDGLVHLAEQPDPKLMWGRYWYRSGTNATMRAELYDIVRQIGGVIRLDPGDLWVDIASNDGTLLSFVDDDVSRVGVDPVEGDIHREALKHAHEVVKAPFTSDVAEMLASGYGEAKVVTCVAMFYDLLDPTDFLAGVHALLDRDGVFVLQLSYTPLMLEQLAFDNICHEHARYYTLTTLRNVLVKAGFQVVDCELNDTNGGSMRVTARRKDVNPETFATQPHRDVADFRVRSLLGIENPGFYDVGGWYNEPQSWEDFSERLDELRTEVLRFIMQAKAHGDRVYAYGASTKGNTLLQYFGLDHTMIDGIAERQTAKVGLRTVGTDIPIVSESDWRIARPEYTLMLPWHFVAAFVEREADYLAAGGRFIVPCPKFSIIGDESAMAYGDGRRPA